MRQSTGSFNFRDEPGQEGSVTRWKSKSVLAPSAVFFEASAFVAYSKTRVGQGLWKRWARRG